MFLTLALITLLLSAFPCIALPPSPPHGLGPLAKVKNGSYRGVHDFVNNQDYFRGMPYAQPPVGDLRLNIPQSLNTTWNGVRSAEQFGPVCVGYGPDNNNFQNSEDCLTINVFRPSGFFGGPLPVAVWIYGGGFTGGAGSAPQYNMSAMLHNSLEIQKPIMTVTFNYRLSGWGWLYSDEIQVAGLTNLGLRDSRVALQWIQENIAAFGGDPTKVTIFGESAGAGIVGAQALAYGGRDDRLFRGLISESGPPQLPGLYPPPLANAIFANVTRDTGCGDASDKIACLRALPFETLNSVLNGTQRLVFLPVIDNDFLTQLPSLALDAGKFTHVPLLVGTNSDEGTFFGPRGINTDADFANYLTSLGVTDNATLTRIMQLYPDDPAEGLPATLPHRPTDPAIGLQYKRSTAFATDFFMLAGRRYSNEKWSKYNVPNYAYRFNVKPAGADIYTGVTHYVEVQFVYDNTAGLGAQPPMFPNGFTGEPQSYKDVANVMSKMWVSFVYDLNPNYNQKAQFRVPDWPAYSLEQPRDFVFDANVTGLAVVEADTFSKEGVDFTNSINPTVFGR